MQRNTTVFPSNYRNCMNLEINLIKSMHVWMNLLQSLFSKEQRKISYAPFNTSTKPVGFGRNWGAKAQRVGGRGLNTPLSNHASVPANNNLNSRLCARKSLQMYENYQVIVCGNLKAYSTSGNSESILLTLPLQFVSQDQTTSVIFIYSQRSLYSRQTAHLASTFASLTIKVVDEL